MVQSTHGSLAGIRERQGRLAEALALNQSLNAEAKSFAASWPLRESTLNIARLLMNQGNYEQAQVWYTTALNGFLEAGDAVQAARTREALSTMYLNHRRTRDAEALLLESRKTYRDIGQTDDFCRVSLQLAELYRKQGRNDEAAGFFEQALAPNLPLSMTPGTISRPLRLWDQGRFDEAIDAYVEVLTQLKSPQGEYALIPIKANLVGALVERGRYDEALDYANDALLPYLLGTSLEPTAYIRLGEIHLKNSQPSQAVKYFKLAEPNITQGGGNILYPALQQGYASAYRQLGEPAKAAQYLESASQFYNRLQKEALYSGGLSSAIGMSRSFAWVCGQLAEDRLAQENLAGAFVAIESGRDRLLAVNEIRRLKFGSANARELRVRLSKAVNELLLARERPGSTPREIQRLQEACEKLEVSLLRETRTFAIAEPSLTSVQATLSDKDGLLSFAWVDKSLHAFLVRRETIEHHKLAWDDASTARILNLLSSHSNSTETREVFAKAYKHLILPFDESLAGLERLAIIPDGSLQTLPFETLVDQNGKHLVEKLDVTFLTSASGLSRSAAKVNGTAFVLGGPAFGDPSQTARWADLPGSRVEAKRVSQILRTQPLLDARATKASFQQLAGQAGLLHIATHAYAASGEAISSPFLDGKSSAITSDNARDPYLESGLVFANANSSRGQEIGVLTGYEVLEMDLSGVFLAVLSACETGRGAATSGEGVLGLRRAFQTAGVQNLVTSLWPVDDADTGDFMTSFYENLASGQPPVRALASTKRRLISGGTPPSSWAAFVLIGPLAGSGSQSFQLETSPESTGPSE